MAHVPVLLNESINFLNPENGLAFVDATANGGGHSAEILKRMSKDAILVAIDRDEEAIADLKKKFLNYRLRFKTVCGNFRELKSLVGKFSKSYDGVLFDLGMSSDQLEKSGRGFSFLKDEPLLMTYEAKPDENRLTAALIVNTWPEGKLAEIFMKYGEERKARRIARALVKERTNRKIVSSSELAKIIAKQINAPAGRHPATKVFQALRIAVNDELDVLEEGLREAWDVLGKEGRMVVISFHSLEDRIVKNFFRNKNKTGLAEVITKKPQTASEEELKRNPSSRSAKLRVMLKIKNA